jgi:hypothetical protein
MKQILSLSSYSNHWILSIKKKQRKPQFSGSLNLTTWGVSSLKLRLLSILIFLKNFTLSYKTYKPVNILTPREKSSKKHRILSEGKSEGQCRHPAGILCIREI